MSRRTQVFSERTVVDAMLAYGVRYQVTTLHVRSHTNEASTFDGR